MVLLLIFLATFAAGIGSVLIAAVLAFGVLSRLTQHLLSLAAGALLATAFMHLLPEAFSSQESPRALFITLLACLIFFFLLDKAQLYHHGHEHGHEHHHDHAHSHSGSWSVLLGDSVHCFGDGVLIASAFIADPRLGWVAALAVLSHEVPHHMGDLAVLKQTEQGARAALFKLCAAGAVTVLGGLAGYLLVAQLVSALPYMLVVAASSFLYVALADLIPQLQKRLSFKETAAQIAWLAIGVVMVALVSSLFHAH